MYGLSVNFNILPYAPNAERMKDVRFTDYSASCSSHPVNRMPSLNEFKDIFNNSDYKIRTIEMEDENTTVIIEDCYDPDGVPIYCYYNNDIISFNQAEFSTAFELCKMICKTFGPFYFGYNSFDEICIMDAETDINFLRAKFQVDQTSSGIEYLKKHGIRKQAIPDDDPRLKEARKDSIYFKAEKLIHDCIESDLRALSFIRHGDWFYNQSQTHFRAIGALRANYTSLGTFYLSATFYIMDRSIYEKEGIHIPDFPDINAFQRVIRYPGRQEFKEWDYKSVTARKITDLEWLTGQKELIRGKALSLVKLINWYK